MVQQLKKEFQENRKMSKCSSTSFAIKIACEDHTAGVRCLCVFRIALNKETFLPFLDDHEKLQHHLKQWSLFAVFMSVLASVV